MTTPPMPDSEKRESRGFARTEKCDREDHPNGYEVRSDLVSGMLYHGTRIDCDVVSDAIQEVAKQARREALEKAAMVAREWGKRLAEEECKGYGSPEDEIRRFIEGK